MSPLLVVTATSWASVFLEDFLGRPTSRCPRCDHNQAKFGLFDLGKQCSFRCQHTLARLLIQRLFVHPPMFPTFFSFPIELKTLVRLRSVSMIL